MEYNGRRILMETITLTYPGHISHWDKRYTNCSSYFRIRDLRTGAIIRNITESCNHSFGSAFIDTDANGAQKLWIFGI